MKLNTKLLTLFFFFFILQINSQSVTIDDTQTPEELVSNLVGNSCALISNISISSNQSVAYFDANGSNFSLPEGIIIRSGIARNTEGNYTGNNLDSQVNTNSDADLVAISQSVGQNSTITDVAFMQFDFVSTSEDFSFNFLFSSNEYGEFQCGFSDVFAFILTDLNTGNAINLAVVPGTTTPISVGTIRDEAFNSTCESVNSNLFGRYNVADVNNSSINMRGETIVLNASATLIPNNSYRIKLVIGDYTDSNFDSAVFLEAGSFGANLDIGEDFTICNGDSQTIDSGFTNTTDYFYEWSRNGVVLLGEENPTLEINQTGTYSLEITSNNANCLLTDELIVTEINPTEPNDLDACNINSSGIFDLTQNNENVFNIDENRYDILYYNSLINANINNPIDSSSLTSYSSAGNETIYARIISESSNFTCTTIYDFELNLVDVVPTQPNNIVACQNDIIDIPSQVENQILNGQPANQFSFLYYTSQTDAENNTNNINNPSQYNNTAIVGTQNIFVRMTNNNLGCFGITNFNIEINGLPPVTTLGNAFVCFSYNLPAISDGNYFTQSGGNGTPLNAGDIISDTTTIFIFADDGTCTNETSFTVTVVDDIFVTENVCEQFIVPDYEEFGNFYTAEDGPNGTGVIITTGEILTTNQTIYFYAQIAGFECFDRPFNITINSLPDVVEMDDVTTCNSYTLPNLPEGNYFTQSQGNGTQLNQGDIITSSQTIFIYEVDANTCANESTFDVTIIDTNSFQDIDACDSYVIPNLTIGDFFTQPNGNGDLLATGTILTTNQTIYFYTPTTNNCADNIPIEIQIFNAPLVDNLSNFLTCEDVPIILPGITNGQYFTQSGGNGTQLNAGDSISTSQTIYIFNTNTNCTNESSFFVEVRPFPAVTNLLDVFSCDTYILPTIANGNFYTQSGGNGTLLNTGDQISASQRIYIYNNYPDLQTCANETFFNINIQGVEVDESDDIAACDSYTLPQIFNGNYFTESGGNGTQLNAGDIITTTQTLYIYNENGQRFSCDAEDEFLITITTTPTLPVFDDVFRCRFYELQDISTADVTIQYARQPNGIDVIPSSEYSIDRIGRQTIFVYAFANENPNCVAQSQFAITINPNRELVIDDGIICVDVNTDQTRNSVVLESGLNPAEFQVEWFLDGNLVETGENFEAFETGVYDVVTTKLTPNDGQNCNFNPTQVTVNASKPDPYINFLNDVFVDSSNIKIEFNDRGFGDYQYSLDDGIFQENDIFLNIPIGEHFITVRDITGICGDIVLPFNVIYYPKFFTPNNDGINDFWNIPDLKNNPEAIVTIYDRFGKLISTFRTSDLGWNGRNKNGNTLTQDDYWFKVEFLFDGEATVFAANFSLIRN